MHGYRGDQLIWRWANDRLSLALSRKFDADVAAGQIEMMGISRTGVVARNVASAFTATNYPEPAWPVRPAHGVPIDF